MDTTPHLRSDARRRPVVASLIALAVASSSLVGCGSGPDPDLAAADRVLAAVGQSPGELASVDEAASAPGCTRTIVVDEYGFEDEIVECPDGPSPGAALEVAALSPEGPLDPDGILDAPGTLPTWVLARLVDALPASPMADGLGELAASADRLDALCGADPAAWADELDRAADRAEAIAELVAVEPAEPVDAAEPTEPDQPADAGLLGSTLARATGRALFERVVLESGCSSPGATAIGYDEAVERGLLSRTSRAALAIAELDRAMSAAQSTRLFHLYSSLPNYEWLRTQREPIDLVVLGTSQAGASIEVPVLAAGTGVTVGNAFLPGSLAEVQQHWVPEVERYIDPARVVWLIGAIDLLIDCDDKGREGQFVERLDNRQRTFARSGWFRTIDPIEAILGPAGEENLNRGNAFKKPAPDADATDAQLRDYAAAFAEPGFCAERASVIGEMVAHLEAEGREVVIVGVPTSPRMAELLPDVDTRTVAALGRLMDEYLADTSARLVDLSGTLREPDSWSDLTHPTQDGADAFTTLVAEALR